MSMKLLPLAFDSMGVRSMATYVETDVKILIDPGAALGPKRYSLPPSPPEEEALEKTSRAVREHALKSDILTLSHYHYDHYFPQGEFWKGKIILAKDPNKTNKSQMKRGKDFFKIIEGEDLRIADGCKFTFENTEIAFSPPFPHGPENTKLGKVLCTKISHRDEIFIHSSDVQGPISSEAKDWIIGNNPDKLFLCGPATLFLGWRLSLDDLKRAKSNIVEILEKTKLKELVLDHHLVRDLKWKERVEEVLQKALDLDKRIITAAEFAGQEPNFLEANRKKIWSEI